MILEAISRDERLGWELSDVPSRCQCRKLRRGVGATLFIIIIMYRPRLLVLTGLSGETKRQTLM